MYLFTRGKGDINNAKLDYNSRVKCQPLSISGNKHQHGDERSY